MNVLIVDQFGEIGGAQLCLLDLVPAVVERGWHAYAALPGEGSLAGRLREAGATVYHIDPGRYASGRKTAADVVRFGSRLRRLANQVDELCDRHAIQLIHVNAPRWMPAVALSSCRVPVLFHAHSYLAKAYARHLLCWAIRRRSAAVVAVSRFVAAQYEASARVDVIPSGVGDLRRDRAASRSPSIGIVGRVAPEKGHLEFIEAARLLSAAVPELSYVVCGDSSIADPAYGLEVRRRAQGLPVEFIGWRDDVAGVLASIDLLAVPSTGEEALGRVVLEAFSAGVPVVAFASGGIPELINEGVTGFFASSRTAEDLASKLLEVVRDLQGAQTVARNARAAWEANYTLDLYRDRMLQAMARAAASGPGSLQPARAKRRQIEAADNRSA